MNIFLMLICIVSQSLQSVFKKKLNVRCADCNFTVGTMISAFTLLYFIVFSRSVVFDMQLLPYSICFAICYAVATVTCVLALACGSLALTDLMLVYSHVIPLVYNLYFCNESLNMIQVVGIVLLGVSFIFTYYRREKAETGGQRISLKWFLYAILLFVSNGMCSVVMRMQQRSFGGAYDSSFMILSLIMVVVLLLTSSLIWERKSVLKAFKRGWFLSGLCGVCNGSLNYFSLMCLLVIPGSVFYPLLSAGSLVLTYILSITMFKEKISRNQAVGFALGILSIVFINIK